jgi:hypothetical protein
VATQPVCLQAKPENLVDTFILLMPATAKTANDLARVCELKVRLRLICYWLQSMCAFLDGPEVQACCRHNSDAHTHLIATNTSARGMWCCCCVARCWYMHSASKLM